MEWSKGFTFVFARNEFLSLYLGVRDLKLKNFFNLAVHFK